jgi:4-amino-4-deoxy-L-arabinose transferase-like glycosyltransferase
MKSRKYLRWILVLSVLVRLAASLVLGDEVAPLPGVTDQLSYHNLAVRVLEGHGFSFGEPWWPVTAANAPTAHWSYLYTLYLVLVYAAFGVHAIAARLIQAIIVGILHPLLVYGIGKRLINEKVGLVAALISAIYGYFIYYSATLMTEPFYILGILDVLYTVIRWAQDSSPVNRSLRYGFFVGIGVAATVLFRQLFLLAAPFILAWLIWVKVRQKQSWFSGVALSLAVVALAILPFTIYNYQRFDRFVLLNTNAGFAFFWGNLPEYGTEFEPIMNSENRSYLSVIPDQYLGLDEAALDQALLKEALGNILADPTRYLLLSLSRIPPYFMFWPSPASGLISNLTRVGSFGLFLPFMLYGLYLWIRNRIGEARFSFSHPLSLLVLFAVVYTGIHVLTWTLVRYRLPVDAVMIVFAGVGLTELGERLWVRRRKNSASAAANA